MKTLFEILWVAALGLGIAVAANALNPSGLEIDRDYFPKPVTRSRPAATPTAEPTAEPAPTPADTTPDDTPTATDDAEPATDDTSSEGTGPDAAEQAVLDRLRDKGFQPLSFEETRAIFDDELYTYELYMFVDARSAERYEAGHIPGAHLFDHYRAPDFIDTLGPLLQTSEKIVVYCTGGDCEDSEFATTTLTQLLGVDPSKLYIYAGGIEDWKARGMPIERGERNSGDIVEGGGR